MTQQPANSAPYLVEVTGCSDGQYWYADQIGQRFPIIYADQRAAEWVVRSSDGFSNIIRFSDGALTREVNKV